MKKILSASLVAALLGGGLALTAATSASAATVPDEFCQAVYETQPNPAYIPAVDEVSHVETVIDTPEVAEVSHVEFRWKSWNWDTLQFDYRWSVGNPGTWWVKTGETRTVIDTPYQAAVTHEVTIIDVPAQPAVGEPTVQVQTGETCEVTLNWGTTFLQPNPQNADHVSWPQPFLAFGADYTPPCGVQVQQDDVRGSREAIDAILADDTLVRSGNHFEDSGLTYAWRFLDGGVCAPDPQSPQVIVTYGEFGGADPSCETPTVTWTRERTTTTTPYLVVGDPQSGWSQVLDVENAVTVVDVDEQLEVHEYDGDCTPPPTGEPEEPQIGTPVTVTKELAHTGADTSPLWIALAMMFVGAMALIGRAAYRTKR